MSILRKIADYLWGDHNQYGRHLCGSDPSREERGGYTPLTSEPVPPGYSERVTRELRESFSAEEELTLMRMKEAREDEEWEAGYYRDHITGYMHERPGYIFHYGDTYEDGYRVDRNTIHDTGTLDIQVDENGEVVAVWFRCLQLPFKVSETPVPGRQRGAYGKVEITGIDWRNA